MGWKFCCFSTFCKQLTKIEIFQEKEISHGAPAPRLLSLDSYFLTEVEKTEKDPETGRRMKKRVQEYEYEAEMEQTYRYTYVYTELFVVDESH